ncbi:VWA domain-containing protein [Nanoarchaeota archaeon]
MDIITKPALDILNSIYKGSFKFQHPEYLWLILAAFFILIFITWKSFVKIDKKRLADPKWRGKRRRLRIFVFLSRLLIFALLFIALADPFGEVKREIPGDLTLHLLMDNSTSMQLYDTDFIPQLREELEKRIPTKTAYISQPLESRIGDGILNNLEKDKNLLLITDGRNTQGTNLLDVLLFAGTLNSSVSAIDLNQIKEDISVTVKGPTKTIADVENTYRVKINRVLKDGSSLKNVRVTVGVDDEVVFDGLTDQDTIPFKYNFTDGYHRIVARLTLPADTPDHFPENNVWYMTTHVIPKPKILLVTQAQTALSLVLDEIYEVTMSTSVPTSKSELEKYYAVIIHDTPAAKLRDIDALVDFVIEGNGLFVIGGYNSFENGGYKGTMLESILPVNIGALEKKRGDANIVLVVDISGSTGYAYGNAAKSLDVEKSLALSVINDINEGNRVGVVAFNDQAYLVNELEPLFVAKGKIIDKVSRLKDYGPTTLNVGLRGAFQLLRGATGSKNVVWITDGVTLDPIDLGETENIVKAMNAYGIKLYIIGTGRNTNEQYLSKMGAFGSGFYLKATDANRLKILFGEPEKKEVGTAFSLFTLNPNHFITEDLEVSAVLYGYNQVVPKVNGNMLITTDSGEPAVVVWRHGIGRVAALTAFSSGNNLGELLDRKNSQLLTRIVNWAIADPERKNDFFVDVKGGRVNKTAEVIVRSKLFPKIKGLDFTKIEKNTYRAYYVSDTVGFKGVLGTIFGINYDWEYQYLGLNPELDALISSTKGKLFTPDQVDEIVEHVKSVSRRIITERTSFKNFFIAAALIFLALEIVIRRIRDTWFK